MKAIIVLDNYPPYLTPSKLYEIKGQSQIDPNIYFVVADDGSITPVDISVSICNICSSISLLCLLFYVTHHIETASR